MSEVCEPNDWVSYDGSPANNTSFGAPTYRLSKTYLAKSLGIVFPRHKCDQSLITLDSIVLITQSAQNVQKKATPPGKRRYRPPKGARCTTFKAVHSQCSSVQS